jgi:hypothetical protein
MTLVFDKAGKPVKYHRPHIEKSSKKTNTSSTLDMNAERGKTRMCLIDAIDDAGLIRPQAGAKCRCEKGGGF